MDLMDLFLLGIGIGFGLHCLLSLFGFGLRKCINLLFKL